VFKYLRRPWVPYVVSMMLVVSFAAVVLALFWIRAHYVDRVFGGQVGCDGCFHSNLLVQDGVYLGSIWLLYSGSFFAHRYYLYLALRVVAALGLLLYWADIYVMEQFFTRLNIADVRIYGAQVGSLVEHLANTGQIDQHSYILSGVLLCVIFWLILPPPRNISRSFFLLSAGVPLLWITFALSYTPEVYVHQWALRNLVAANVQQGVTRSYSETYTQSLRERFGHRKEVYCDFKPVPREDFILLILESWSPYQSELWGGFKNWTPKLDALAKNNVYFTRLHAAGFSTNEGLMSLMTGMEFLSPVKSLFSIAPYEGAWNREFTLPGVFGAAGYHTAFLTSGNLGFSAKGEWLADLKFDYVEGHDYIGYKDVPRLHFSAVPDDVLYDRSLDYLAARWGDHTAPLFMAIESVSTHHPYTHPYTRESGEEVVFRFMDESVDAFYHSLREMGYFARGGKLLMISDHRAMIPIRHEEAERWGRAAASLIPAILIDDSLAPAQVDLPFHQSDLLSSVMRELGGKSCALLPDRNLFAWEESGMRCLFHARGDQRDHIDVFCPQGEGTITLNGDKTTFINSQNISDAQKLELLEYVNHLRLRDKIDHD
jgi:lipoteichoic acid synthase